MPRARRFGASQHLAGAPGACENRRGGRRQDVRSERAAFGFVAETALSSDPPQQPRHSGPGDEFGVAAARHRPSMARQFSVAGPVRSRSGSSPRPPFTALAPPLAEPALLPLLPCRLCAH
jgi:hypothetical protein